MLIRTPVYGRPKAHLRSAKYVWDAYPGACGTPYGYVPLRTLANMMGTYGAPLLRYFLAKTNRLNLKKSGHHIHMARLLIVIFG